MVQGINVKNYSVEQLKELKNAGMQGISDDDIKAAEKQEAEAAKDAKASDEANVSYTITDDAGKTNEAKQEVDTAKEYGANLKTILQNLIPKTDTKNEEMAKLSEELAQYEVQMSDIFGEEQELKEDTTEELNDIQDSAETKQAEAEEKQAEIAEKEEEIKQETEVATELAAEAESAETPEEAKEIQDKIDDSQGKIDTTQAEVDDLKAEIQTAVKDIQTVEAKAAAKIQEAAAVKAQLLGKSMEDVKNLAEASLNDAVNANEYADVTIEQGTEAANITSKSDAKKAGFIKGNKSGIIAGAVIGGALGGIGGAALGGGIASLFKKGDVKAANAMGNTAIAHGEQLGNSSQEVAKGVANVANQYGFAFDENTAISDVLDKQYVDTSKMSELQNVSDQKGIFKKIKTAVSNQNIINEIADASKNKVKKEDDANVKNE